jgi:hypothetical protein
MWKKTGSIAILLLPAIACSSELRLTASVDRTQVGLGETFDLTVSVHGENIGDVPSPTLPELPDFDIIGRSSSQETSIQLINGKVTQQQGIHFIYTLSPKKLGKASIGAVTLEYGGRTFKTQTTEVNVVQGSTKKPSQRSLKSTPPAADVASEDDLMLLATANRKNVYWGEEVVVEFALYSRVHMSDVNLAEPPTFSGFWVKPIYDAKRLDFQRESLNGKPYDVCVLKRCALLPLSSGQLEIGEMNLNVAVVKRSRDFFDFFGRTRTVSIRSKPIVIDVKPLPTEDRPSEFTGGVGKFTINASLDRTASEAAEPVTLTVRLTGAGSIPFIEKPTIPIIPGVKTLDPEVRESAEVVGDRIKGYKEFRYPVLPQTDGEHLIPSIGVAYFDLEDEAYRIIETEGLRFTASRTAAATESGPTGGLKVLGTDIRFIKPDLTQLKSQRIAPQGWLIFIYIGSVGLMGLSLLLRRHRTKLMTDRAYARRLRSNRMMKRRLKQAEISLRNNDEKKFYSSLSKAALGYLGDRYNWDVHAMTKDELRGQLRKEQVREEVIDKIIDLLGQCDIACFSPSLMAIKEPRELFSQLRDVLSEL